MDRTKPWMPRAAAAALGLLVAACATDTTEDPTLDYGSADGAADSVVEDVATGKADGWSVDEVELGGSYRYRVAAQQGATVTAEHAKIMRFQVDAGQTFAAVMRRTDASELDAALILYHGDAANGSDRIAASLHDQALVPMGVEEDAVLVHTSATAQSYLLYASDLELRVSGSFQVDLVALELDPPEPTVVDAWADLDLSVTDAALRIYTERLRDHEPQISDYVARGVLEEGADGYLVRHEDRLETLLERAELRRFVDEIDELRGLLFQGHAEKTGSQNPLLVERVGAACGGTWSALRSAGHAVP